LIEHGLDEPVIGVAFDGSGYGEDGAIWGGEFFVADRASARRVAHLRPVPLPGGESAIREPWRMAAAYLWDAGVPLDALAAPGRALEELVQVLERRALSPLTSSVGRLFDAASVLAGLGGRRGYDGQPAIELEWAAMTAQSDGAYPMSIERPVAGGPLIVDPRPCLMALLCDRRAGIDTARVARRFHGGLGEAVVRVCQAVRDDHGLSRVALAGGVFNNALLVDELERLLPASGFDVLRPRAFPPGDGGLSLGQLAIGAARSAQGGL
jgi:hydrogenase maturation protein HypF